MNHYLQMIAQTILLVVTSPLLAQVSAPTPEAPPPISLKAVTLEKASLPGSALSWTKIITEFESKLTWADGITFSYSVIVTDGVKLRLLVGGVRYANIPKGANRAVMYLSPRATARFGSPVACIVEGVFDDEEIGSVKWKNPSAPSIATDLTTLDRRNGVLLNILSTPWVVYDFEKSPDVLVLQ